MPAALRSLLLFALVLGLLGTEAELLLLGHFEDAWQLVPIVLIGIAITSLVVYGVSRTRRAVRAVQVTMLLFVVAGVLGTWLHYQSNAQFELEIAPEMLFWPLFKAAMAGSMPVLAPGAMIQLGLIGLSWSFRHPALVRTHSSSSPQHP
ncbi:MAG TPA: hypothetical protein VJR92_10475 [Gemmatimonadaceae bacterium]|nr:hypothetical protein [Gemmatimonadaceae bacterium]